MKHEVSSYHQKDASRDANLRVLLLLARLEVLPVLLVLDQVVGIDMELVRVGVGILGVSELLDQARTALEELPWI